MGVYSEAEVLDHIHVQDSPYGRQAEACFNVSLAEIRQSGMEIDSTLAKCRIFSVEIPVGSMANSDRGGELLPT